MVLVERQWYLLTSVFPHPAATDVAAKCEVASGVFQCCDSKQECKDMQLTPSTKKCCGKSEHVGAPQGFRWCAHIVTQQRCLTFFPTAV